MSPNIEASRDFRPSFGTLVNRSLKVLRVEAAYFLVVALKVMWPLLLLPFLRPFLPVDSYGWQDWGVTFEPYGGLRSVLYLLLGSLTFGALVHRTSLRLRGLSPGDSPDSLRSAFHSWFDLMVAMFLVSLLAGLGFFFFIIPGLLLLTLYSLTAPVVIVEDHSPMEALGRSRQLTEGYRLPLFGFVILSAIVDFLAVRAHGVAAEWGVPLWGQDLGVFLYGVAGTVVGAAVVGVAHHELRVAKEAAGGVPVPSDASPAG